MINTIKELINKINKYTKNLILNNNKNSRLIYQIGCLFFLCTCFLNPSYGQRNKNKIALEEFRPINKSGAVYCPQITFLNIESYRYYYDPRQLKEIKRLQQENNLPELKKALDTYIRYFGIENFKKDLDLIWAYAQAAEKTGNQPLALELYRLLLKHHRGSSVKSQLAFDSLASPSEKPKYVPLKYYYELIDKWQLVDTLRPPDQMGTSMGEEINSPYEEYGLAIGQTDSIIYFTSKRLLMDTVNDPVRKYLPADKFDENIYKSVRLGEFGWDYPLPLKGLNTRYNEGSPCISRDGRYMAFSRCDAPDGFGDCDLYLAKWNEDDNIWDEVQNFGVSVNSTTWDSHPSFSVTGDTLFFASDRKTGFGGTDIYFTVRQGRKRWSVAQNIGPIINTQANELSPFLHPSDNILYFSSNGHLFSFGSYDIFKSYKTSRDTWCEPKNLGPFVNTKSSEYYFTIDAAARLLYYARAEKEVRLMRNEPVVQDPYTNSDLYSFPLPMEAQPKAIVRFSGKVKESQTGEIFGGVVVVYDVADKIPIAPKYIDEEGNFEFELIDKKKYLLIVSGENFFRLEELFEVDGDTYREVEVQGVRQKVATSPASQIETIQFKSIEFAPNSTGILPKMENDLHLIIDFLVEHPDFNLEIFGHTDSDGNKEANKELSFKRAESIRNYILSYGRLESDRIKPFGLGSEKPLVFPEITEEDKRVNRRVEFRLFKKDMMLANPNKENEKTEEELEQERLENVEEEIKDNENGDW
ncbi:OmpA family protein [Bernardetia sp. OM2101]|uniref:OmpA family protein n=1 Tax=Bernardetia sp. OM2101 TaxID=3344876 RepID=UPI0035D07233